MTKFMEMVAAQRAEGKHLCIGIDPVQESLPEGTNLISFCEGLIEATAPYAAAFKPNIAFFEAFGSECWKSYHAAVQAVRTFAPDIPVIGDRKDGDIGKTNRGYVFAAFEDYKVDAVTLHPYLGRESLEGFLKWEDKGLIILCKTSNPGAGEFQDRLIKVDDRPILGQEWAPLYQMVARNVSEDWNTLGNCGLVVGATYPEELRLVRQIAPELFVLIPGIGTQGGDLEASVINASGETGDGEFVTSVSSAISEAFKKHPDLAWDEAAALVASDYDDQIGRVKKTVANV